MVAEPRLTDDIVATALDPAARADLRGLQKDTADSVARHLVAAGMLVDVDPEAALAHARFARRRASRIAVVREAAGITAYHAGEWAEALSDLRAARRMGGGPGHLAVMADIERALRRPERALELTRSPEARDLDRAETIELAIVAAGARRDLGELDAAVVGLQIPELDPARREPWSARLFYAYADNLLAVGRESDAVQWFVHAVDADPDGDTDADRRLADLTGEPLPGDDVDFDVEDAEDAVEYAEDVGETDDVPDAGGLVETGDDPETGDLVETDDDPETGDLVETGDDPETGPGDTDRPAGVAAEPAAPEPAAPEVRVAVPDGGGARPAGPPPTVDAAPVPDVPIPHAVVPDTVSDAATQERPDDRDEEERSR